MKNQMNSKYWLLIIASILILFSVREYFNQKNTDKLINNISNYKDTVRFEKLKNGAIISINSSLKLETDKQIRDLASNLNDTIKQMVNQFKKLQSVTYVTNNFEAKNDTINFDNNIPCDFKPFKINKSDNNYTLEATLSKSNFVVDRLFIPNKITIVAGRKKTGFMKYEDVVSVNNSNPLMIASNITDYRLNPKKTFFQKTSTHIGIGVVSTLVAKIGIQFLINSVK